MSNPNSVPVSAIAAAMTVRVVMLNIGLFINAVVKFLVVAFTLFFVVEASIGIGNRNPRLTPH